MTSDAVTEPVHIDKASSSRPKDRQREGQVTHVRTSRRASACDVRTNPEGRGIAGSCTCGFVTDQPSFPHAERLTLCLQAAPPRCCYIPNELPTGLDVRCSVALARTSTAH